MVDLVVNYLVVVDLFVDLLLLICCCCCCRLFVVELVVLNFVAYLVVKLVVVVDFVVVNLVVGHFVAYLVV